MRLVGHVACKEDVKIHTQYYLKILRIQTICKAKAILGDNIKMYLRELKCRDIHWIYLAYNNSCEHNNELSTFTK
jgi:hypothetical protein